jgi:acyl carrier protein
MNIVSLSETSAPLAPASGAQAHADLAVLHRFFDQLAPGAKPRALTLETALLASGVLDSLAILQLTVFLSDEFGIEIGDEDFTIENFATIGTLLDFIATKRNG